MNGGFITIAAILTTVIANCCEVRNYMNYSNYADCSFFFGATRGKFSFFSLLR